jgi:hypothetical protein
MMTNSCYAETCKYWTGDGCICEVMDIDDDDREVNPDEW